MRLQVLLERTIIVLVVIVLSTSFTSLAYAPTPIFGIGALLFRPRNVQFVKVQDYAQRKKKQRPRSRNAAVEEEGEEEVLEDPMTMAGKFFVDAFWQGKLGGPTVLSPNQCRTIERQQIAEFQKRYGGGASMKSKVPSYSSSSSSSGTTVERKMPRLPGTMMTMGSTNQRRAELVLCIDGTNNSIVGCAGIEIDKIKKMDGYDGSIQGPVMSNLAISRNYRRRGLAEDLVRSCESIARKEWGYSDCYLYVERRNIPACKLYEKLGYNVLWTDESASTLLPTQDGSGLMNGRTTIVCMKKTIGKNALFGNLFRQ
jgi:ribosomal protein S18 acetylase RimI-like enzyme